MSEREKFELDRKEDPLDWRFVCILFVSSNQAGIYGYASWWLLCEGCHELILCLCKVCFHMLLSIKYWYLAFHIYGCSVSCCVFILNVVYLSI